MRAYLEGRSRQRAYPPNTIERLIEGEIWIADERWILASPTWAEARSLIEHRGNVESEACVEMLDLERAISRLASRHRAAAALVILTLFGWSRDEISRVLDLHMPYDRLLAKAKNYLQADLNGEDPEQAFKSTMRPGEEPWHGRIRTWHAPTPD